MLLAIHGPLPGRAASHRCFAGLHEPGGRFYPAGARSLLRTRTSRGQRARSGLRIGQAGEPIRGLGISWYTTGHALCITAGTLAWSSSPCRVSKARYRRDARCPTRPPRGHGAPPPPVNARRRPCELSIGAHHQPAFRMVAHGKSAGGLHSLTMPRVGVAARRGLGRTPRFPVATRSIPPVADGLAAGDADAVASSSIT